MTRRPKALTLIIYAVAAAMPVLAGGACLYLWQKGAAVRELLTGEPAALAGSADAAETAVQIEREKMQLAGRIAQRRKEIAGLSGPRRAEDAGAVRQLTLDVLSLAGRCGITVEEVIAIGTDDKLAAAAIGSDVTIAGGRDKAVEYLNRFAVGGVRRPLVKLRCRADYPAVHQFFIDVNRLPSQVTPVLFDMALNRPGQGTPEAGEGLLLNIILAL